MGLVRASAWDGKFGVRTRRAGADMHCALCLLACLLAGCLLASATDISGLEHIRTDWEERGWPSMDGRVRLGPRGWCSRSCFFYLGSGK